MKKIAVILFSLYLYSCGGVVGNIEMETFNCDTLAFQYCFNNLFNEKILLKPDSSLTYKNDGESKIALAIYKRDTFAFVYEITTSLNRNNLPMLIITNFGKHGSVLGFEKELSNEQKNIIEKIYSDQILSHLKKCKCMPLKE